MTEELKHYLELSKEHRQKLKNLAQEIHSSHLKGQKTEEELAKDFPELNPKRFKNFEANLNVELQQIFSNDTQKNKAIASAKSRFVSTDRKRLEQIYNFMKVKAKRISFLPPIARDRERSIPARLLATKKRMESESGSETIKTLESNDAKVKRCRMTRYDVKKLLFKPILQKKYSELLEIERK